MALSASVSFSSLVIIDHNIELLTRVLLDHWKKAYVIILQLVDDVLIDHSNAFNDSSLHVCMLPVAEDVADPW